jgi:deoxyadenosine/deoxycytidine kinase
MSIPRPTDEEFTDSLNRSAAVIARVIESETRVYQALSNLVEAIDVQTKSLIVIQATLLTLLDRSERRRRWF